MNLELIKRQLGLEQVEALLPSDEAARTEAAEHVLLLENPTPLPLVTRSPFSSANRSLRLKTELMLLLVGTFSCYSVFGESLSFVRYWSSNAAQDQLLCFCC